MFGITNLSIVPLRTEPSDKSEQCSQLLFGDFYTIIDENEKWLRIQTAFDQYQGWIDRKQHHEVSSDFYHEAITSPIGVCFDDIAIVDSNKSSKTIVLGSNLPLLNGRKFYIGSEKYEYQGELYQHIDNQDIDFIKFLLLRYNHAPYLWGGKTIFGTDCSGYVQIIYKLLGYQLMRDAYQQINHGIDVELADIKTGDLAFFANEQGKIVHVGIILEQNKIIHAHGEVRIDIVDEKGIFNLTTKKYSHNLSKFKRII